MKTGTRVLASAGIATAVLALGTSAGIGISSADPAPSSPSPSASRPTASHDHKHHKARTALQRTEHGELTLAGKKHRVIDIQRGTVSSVSSTSIKITSKDDFAASYLIDAKSVVRERAKGKKPTKSSASAIKTGDQVRVVATKSNGKTTATRIAFTG